MTDERWHMGVLIPARNEEDLLPQCLASVLEACAAVADKATCDVVVAVDRSMDDSYAIAQKMLASAGVAPLQNLVGEYGCRLPGTARVAGESIEPGACGSRSGGWNHRCGFV
jgi:cellulose synthase/poly-beta-1,6-N-acetylglucosamine synthase-like glycosyltransferase